MHRPSDGYDIGTRVWTTVFGVLVAAVIDWFAVINPAQGIVVEEPLTGWWLAALIVVCAAPATWLTERLAARVYPQAIIWTVVLIALAGLHFLALMWANAQ